MPGVSIHYSEVFSKQNKCGILRVVLMISYQSAGILFLRISQEVEEERRPCVLPL